MALIHSLNVSCDKASALMEEREFRALSGGERVGLWFHMRICDACKAYEKQSQAIDRLLEVRMAKGEDTRALEARILNDLQA